MKTNRAIILVFAIAAIVAVATLPCPAAQNDDKSIFTEGDERGPGPRPGFGPGRGPGREGPGRGRFDLTDEEVDHIMEGLRERSPEKAKELEKLRDKEPEKFNAELRRHAREEFGKVVKERIEKLRQQRQAEFLEWLAKNVSDEAEELAKLKESSPDLYGEKYELVWKKYGRTFEESRRSPELAQVLIEDIRLQKRRDQLLGKINTTTSQREKKKLTAELEEVVGHRYDLIVRRKQIAYEWLLKRLEELQNRINESSADIRKAQDTKVKAENVKKRTQELLEEKKGFNWN
jgi:DNA-binding Lrp family transcriptional regulator